MRRANGDAEPGVAGRAFDAAERAAFHEELAGINLRRILWIGLAGVVIDLILLACNRWQPAFGVPSFNRDLWLDVGGGAIILPVAWWLSRQAGGLAWKNRFVLGFVVVQLVLMDGYHFSLLPDFGATSTYLIGVMLVGGVVLAPPRILLPMLAANHAGYAACLFWSGQDDTQIMRQFVENTVGVILVMLVAWFLFAAKLGDFRKERLITQRSQELADANAEINEVMAIAAHDLRSPLQVLRSLLELAGSNADIPAAQRARMLAAGVDSCDEMTGRVDQLLAAHEAEQRSAKVRLERADLGERCIAAVGRLQPAADAKGICLMVDGPDAPAEARIDVLALDRVLENLLGNAVKYSPARSTVKVGLRADGPVWRIEVIDQGPGVPPEEQAQLFQKFFRGSARPTAGESSTGLGLFIVKTLTEAMGGRVSHAARETGETPGTPRGSVIRIELPRL